MRIWIALVLFQYGFVSLQAQVILDKTAEPELQKIDVVEHLGDSIPLDIEVTDDAGHHGRLGDYLKDGKPVVLTLAYYKCPMLCTLVLNGVAGAAKELAWLPGNEFQMLTVSIDPKETAELAAQKKKNYLDYLGKPGIGEGWRFMVAEASQSKKLADALGFKYFYVQERNEFAHPAVAFILTGTGKISRYLYGIQFKERDLRLALVEASEGKIGTSIDRLILYCFHYDPQAKGYVVMAGNVMKIGGVLTMLVLGGFLLLMWRKDKTKLVD